MIIIENEGKNTDDQAYPATHMVEAPAFPFVTEELGGDIITGLHIFMTFPYGQWYQHFCMTQATR